MLAILGPTVAAQSSNKILIHFFLIGLHGYCIVDADMKHRHVANSLWCIGYRSPTYVLVTSPIRHRFLIDVTCFITVLCALMGHFERAGHRPGWLSCWGRNSIFFHGGIKHLKRRSIPSNFPLLGKNLKVRDRWKIFTIVN